MPTTLAMRGCSHVHVGEHGEVGRAGEVALVVVAGGRGVAGAAEPELGGLLVHAGDELVDAAGDVLCERDGGVVAGGQQQAVEQALERHVAAEREHADLRPGHVDGLLGDEHGRVGRRGGDGEQRGHHLREAGDGQAHVGVALPEHLTGGQVEQQPGARWVAEGDLHGILAGRRDAAEREGRLGAAEGRRESAQRRAAERTAVRPARVRARADACGRSPARLAKASAPTTATASTSNAPSASNRLRRRRLAARARRLWLCPGVRNGEMLILEEDCAARRRCQLRAARR